jgi:hypothetical protein
MVPVYGMVGNDVRYHDKRQTESLRLKPMSIKQKIKITIELLLLGTGDDNIYIDNIRRGQA